MECVAELSEGIAQGSIFALYAKAPGPWNVTPMFVPAFEPLPATLRSGPALGNSRRFLEIGSKWLGLLRLVVFVGFALVFCLASGGFGPLTSGEWGAFPERFLSSLPPDPAADGADSLVEADSTGELELEAIESDLNDPGPDWADPRVSLRLLPAYPRGCEIVLRDTYVARASSGFHRLGFARGPPRA